MLVSVCIYIFSLWTVLSATFRLIFFYYLWEPIFWMYCSKESISVFIWPMWKAWKISRQILSLDPYWLCGHVEWVEVVVQMGGLDMPVNGGHGTIFLYCSILSEDVNFWTAHCIVLQFLLISIRFCLCSLAALLLNLGDVLILGHTLLPNGSLPIGYVCHWP